MYFCFMLAKCLLLPIDLTKRFIFIFIFIGVFFLVFFSFKSQNIPVLAFTSFKQLLCADKLSNTLI